MLLKINFNSNEELVSLAEIITKDYMETHKHSVSEENVYRVVIRVLHGNTELSYKAIREYIKNQWNNTVNINIFKLYSSIYNELLERKLIKVYEDDPEEIRTKIKDICFSKMTRKGYDSLVKTLNETRDENLEAIFDFVIHMSENFEED